MLAEQQQELAEKVLTDPRLQRTSADLEMLMKLQQLHDTPHEIQRLTQRIHHQDTSIERMEEVIQAQEQEVSKQKQQLD